MWGMVQKMWGILTFLAPFAHSLYPKKLYKISNFSKFFPHGNTIILFIDTNQA